MAVTRQFDSTGEGGGRGLAYWAGFSSVTTPSVFTGTPVGTGASGGAGGQASNLYVGSAGNDGSVRLRWPLNSGGTIDTVPSSGPIKFSDLGKLGRNDNQSSISMGNYFRGSIYLPTEGTVGNPPNRFNGDQIAPRPISAYRGVYIDLVRNSTPFLIYDIDFIPAYVRYVAIQVIGAGGGAGGGDASVIAGNGGAGLALDGLYDLNNLSFSVQKRIIIWIGQGGPGGTKTTGVGSSPTGGTGFAGGGQGGTAGTSGASGAGGAGGGSSAVRIFDPSTSVDAYFIAGGGGGGGGAGRFTDPATKNGNTKNISDPVLTTNLSLMSIFGDPGDNYGSGDGGGCGGGGGSYGPRGVYEDPPPDPGGGGGNDPCLAYGTMIAMADGTFKPVEELVVGDLVKSLHIESLGQDENSHINWNSTTFNVEPAIARVKSILLGSWYRYCDINDGFLLLTNDHELLIQRNGEYRFIPAADIQVGDSLYNVEGQWISVYKHEKVQNTLNFVSIDVEDEDTYFANGILTHNFDGDPVK